MRRGYRSVVAAPGVADAAPGTDVGGDRAQLLGSQPRVVAVGRVVEPVGQLVAARGGGQRAVRQDDVAVAQVIGVACLVLGQQRLVQLLAGTDAGDDPLRVGRERRRDV